MLLHKANKDVSGGVGGDPCVTTCARVAVNVII